AYSWCVPVPDDIHDTKACFAYINPLTAWLMVEQHCSDQTGQVAITGATTTIASHLAEFLTSVASNQWASSAAHPEAPSPIVTTGAMSSKPVMQTGRNSYSNTTGRSSISFL